MSYTKCTDCGSLTLPCRCVTPSRDGAGSEKACEHSYQYMGLRWRDTRRSMPGTGATPIEYYDVFFCTKCLDEQKKDKGCLTNSYQKRLEGSTPL